MHEGASQKTRTLAIRGALVPPLPVSLRLSRAGAPLGIGHGEALAHLLTSGTATVGAASTCDVVIDDDAVSRRHLELELVPEGVLVRDLGSRNGTFYLGQRLERMILSPGAVLQLGATTLTIDLAPGAVDGDEPLRLGGFRGMIGSSAAMQALFGKIARLDGSLLPVLLLGETGSGKELVARALHEGSRAAEGPFVAMNCGGLARELLESTLFGHRKGAFTGATDARRGAFGAADGGTLLLDEIGELPLEMQPSLLRALESGEITALGEDAPRRVTVRVIAATNRDLQAEMRAGRFREDLYYRLGGIALRVPPLRERAEDIPLLAEAFARQEGSAGLPADIRGALAQQSFRGNVRELRNAVRAYVALGELDLPAGGAAGAGGHALAPSIEQALASAVRLDAPFLEQREAIAERFSAAYVDRVLQETGGNQTAAAKLAGLDRTYFGRLLAKLGRR
ncbi:MAG TPA: sigma 54-interacting transcriptional regulator [Labilithrix sp.]|nr:sigma 54-interacting transcriptional regulator [Labilithrix sp.]